MTDTDTYYPRLREALDDQFLGLTDAQLDDAFADAFGEGVSPAEYEEFFGAIGKALKKAAPTIAAVGKGALGGAAAGSAAGPFGALGGALLGGVGSALSRQRSGQGKGLGRGLTSVVNTAGTLAGQPIPQVGASASGALSGGSGTATSALRMVLSRPETGRALRSLFSGTNAAIPVGGAGGPAIPAGAFAGLLGALAGEAEAEAFEGASEDAATVPGYLVDANGQLVVDPADPDLRSARVLQLLASIPPEGDAAQFTGMDESEGDDDIDDEYTDDFVDVLDLDVDQIGLDEFWASPESYRL